MPANIPCLSREDFFTTSVDPTFQLTFGLKEGTMRRWWLWGIVIVVLGIIAFAAVRPDTWKSEEHKRWDSNSATLFVKISDSQRRGPVVTKEEVVQLLGKPDLITTLGNLGKALPWGEANLRAREDLLAFAKGIECDYQKRSPPDELDQCEVLIYDEQSRFPREIFRYDTESQVWGVPMFLIDRQGRVIARGGIEVSMDAPAIKK
jgi:hypothetical protein